MDQQRSLMSCIMGGRWPTSTCLQTWLVSGDDGIRQWAAIAYRPYQLAENVPYIPVGPWFKASTVRLEMAHLNQSQEKELFETVFYWCPPKGSKHFLGASLSYQVSLKLWSAEQRLRAKLLSRDRGFWDRGLWDWALAVTTSQEPATRLTWIFAIFVVLAFGYLYCYSTSVRW